MEAGQRGRSLEADFLRATVSNLALEIKERWKSGKIGTPGI